MEQMIVFQFAAFNSAECLKPFPFYLKHSYLSLKETKVCIPELCTHRLIFVFSSELSLDCSVAPLPTVSELLTNTRITDTSKNDALLQ